MKFAPSVSQIFRRIFAPDDEAIRVQEVQSLDQAGKQVLQLCLLKDILKELRIMNTHFSLMTDEEIREEDLDNKD